MPSIYRPTYRDKKTGKTKTTEMWFARIQGRRVSLHTQDRKIAERKAVSMEQQQELGYDPGALDAARRRSIMEHFVDFIDSLKDREVGDRQIEGLSQKLPKIFEACGIKTIADIDGQKVESYLSKCQREKLSVQSRKHYATNLKQFGRWLMTSGRVTSNPFREVRTDLNVGAGRVHERRALSPADCQTFLAITRQSQQIMGRMTGLQRYYLYALAVTTGLRRNELGSLTRESFDLKAGTVLVTGKKTKNRREAVQPLRADLIAELREWLETFEIGQVLFPVAGRRMGYVVKYDLNAAGIPYEVGGRVIDFHSLRGTFITHLGLSGVPLVTAQRLARHSDPRLTSNAYTFLGMADLALAVEKLPSMGEPKSSPGTP